MRDPIALRVLCGSDEHELITYEGEYRSLMMLIYDRIFIPYFGECKGMGRCGTCMVTVNSTTSLLSMDRNEQATITKLMGTENSNYRLACQILINQSLHRAVVRVLDEDELT